MCCAAPSHKNYFLDAQGTGQPFHAARDGTNATRELDRREPQTEIELPLNVTYKWATTNEIEPTIHKQQPVDENKNIHHSDDG